jgi:hypothetical protein
LFHVRPADLAKFLELRILHANTLVLRRELITSIGLYWDKINFAEDHNLSLRLADSARKTLFCSTVAAELDVGDHSSIARRYNEQEVVLFDMIALMHAECQVRSPRLRRVARRSRAGRGVKLSRLLLTEGRGREALSFAVQSLVTSPHLGTARHLCWVLLQMAWPSGR